MVENKQIFRYLFDYLTVIISKGNTYVSDSFFDNFQYKYNL